MHIKDAKKISELKPRQVKFIKYYFQTRNATEAYMIAYNYPKNKRNVASVLASRLLRKVKYLMGSIIERNIGEMEIISVLKGALKANKQYILRGGEGEIKESPDFMVRLKAVDLTKRIIEGKTR